MIECILGTDMAKHKAKLIKFEKSSDEIRANGNKLDFGQEISVASMYIHICDLSGNAKEYDVALEWGKRVRQEFIDQVGLE